MPLTSTEMTTMTDAFWLPSPSSNTTANSQASNIFFPDTMALNDVLATSKMSLKPPETPPGNNVFVVTPSFVDLPTCDLLKTPDFRNLELKTPDFRALGLQGLADVTPELGQVPVSLELASPRIVRASDGTGISRNLYEPVEASPSQPVELMDFNPDTLGLEQDALQNLTLEGFLDNSAKPAEAIFDNSANLSFQLLEDFSTPMQDGGTSCTSSESSSNTAAPTPAPKRAKRTTRRSSANAQQDSSYYHDNASSSDTDDDSYTTQQRRSKPKRRKSSKCGGTRRVENMSESKRKHIRKLARAAAKRRKERDEALWKERAAFIAGLDSRRARLQADIVDTQTQITSLLQRATALV
eukprot:m.92422 g.92422  ORF g.92422 m.92422 type:complete len:354 (-) comp14944_c1_seq1:3085-4146(-)